MESVHETNLEDPATSPNSIVFDAPLLLLLLFLNIFYGHVQVCPIWLVLDMQQNLLQISGGEGGGQIKSVSDKESKRTSWGRIHAGRIMSHNAGGRECLSNVWQI